MTINTHQGHTITLNGRHRFDVAGPNIEKQEFRSYDEATQAIDAAIVKATKQARVSEKLALPALDASGNPVTLRGVHAAQGTLLGCETDAYPAVEWLGPLLRERAACRNRASALDRMVGRFAINHRRNYGRVGDYDAAIESLKNDYAVSTERAVAATPKAE